jgi:peptidoglycan/LPS O-acetylase OafA/YrhL
MYALPVSPVIQEEPGTGLVDQVKTLPPKLNLGGSILLDILRFGAASTVLLSHFSNPTISLNLPDLATAGHLAVAVFFVLSGFVIRYVTLSRPIGATEYVIDRASRIYSVALPALLITVLCEVVARHYPRYHVLIAPFPWHSVPFQVVANLLFQAQDWGYEIRPLSNAPFWSLSFECFYYAFYGLFFYRVRHRVPLCLLLFLLAGPSIVLMFPVWLLGCFAFDTYHKLSTSRLGIFISSITFALVLLVLFSARVGIHQFLLSVDEWHRTAWLTRLLLQVPHHEIVFANGIVPWLVSASPSFLVVGFATAVSLTWALLIISRFKERRAGPITKWIRFVADSTFALYLLHLPFLLTIECILGKPVRGWRLQTAILIFIVFACVVLAVPMDALKRHMRSQMQRLRLYPLQFVNGESKL